MPAAATGSSIPTRPTGSSRSCRPTNRRRPARRWPPVSWRPGRRPGAWLRSSSPPETGRPRLRTRSTPPGERPRRSSTSRCCAGPTPPAATSTTRTRRPVWRCGPTPSPPRVIPGRWPPTGRRRGRRPPPQGPGLRARLARAAMLAGDLASAEEALRGLEADGGPHDAAILLASGMLSYFTGDLERAEVTVDRLRSVALTPGAPDRLLDVITLQGMIAHSRGEWFDRLRRELRATSDNPQLASAVFDSHLCVAEYLLYGPTPYAEVVALAHGLRRDAERTGARRAVAFAVTVAGEAAFLAGDLDTARRDLL